jgi:hypothetical protein
MGLNALQWHTRTDEHLNKAITHSDTTNLNLLAGPQLAELPVKSCEQQFGQYLQGRESNL